MPSRKVGAVSGNSQRPVPAACASSSTPPSPSASSSLLAKTDPLLFDAMLDHGLAAASASAGLIPDARELIQRGTRGIPGLISHLLRIALTVADERGLTTIDVSVVNTAAILLHLKPPKPPSILPPKPRYDRDSRSRG